MLFIQILLAFHRCVFYFLENLAMTQSIFNWLLSAIGFFVSLNVQRDLKKKNLIELNWGWAGTVGLKKVL